MQKVSSGTWVPRLLSCAACLIAVVLLIAAAGKFFAPAPAFVHLDRSISLFEVVLAVLFVWFRKSVWMWIGAASLFALWGGYALFWYCVQLPCGCMGAKLALPSLFSLLFDGFFLLFSLFAVYFLGVKKGALCSLVCLSPLLAGGGFVIAQGIFQKFLSS